MNGSVRCTARSGVGLGGLAAIILAASGVVMMTGCTDKRVDFEQRCRGIAGVEVRDPALWARYKAELAAKHEAVSEPLATRTLRGTESFELIPAGFDNGSSEPPFDVIYNNDFKIIMNDRTIAIIRSLSLREKNASANVTRYCIYEFEHLYQELLRDSLGGENA